MKHLLPLVMLACLACGSSDHTHDDPNDPQRGICNDIYNHTDECLVDIGCEGISDRQTYVDQCLTQDYTAAERDQFVATSCDAANASACTSATSFYRDSCDCSHYTICPSGLTCTDTGGDLAACFESTGGPPDNGASCDATHDCQAGYGCALTSADASAGVCVQFCAL